MERIEKLIVLDIDEVLNSIATQILARGAFKQFDPVSVSLLSSLIEGTGAKVLISSSWRLGCRGDVEKFRWKLMVEWREKVGEADINALVNNIVGLTPDLSFLYTDRMSRGREIATWIDTHAVNKYVILDDGDCVLPHQRPYFVHVPAVDGLRLVHYWKALKILMPEHPRVKGLEQYFNKRYYKTYVDQLLDDKADDQPNPDGE